MVVGVVLAGGRSLRMGTDKGGLVLGGQTLGQRACSLLLQTCDEVVVVAPDSSRLPWWRGARISDPGLGPLLAAYAAALDRPYADGWLFLPADQPLLTLSSVAALIAHPATSVRPAGDKGDTLPWLLRRSMLPMVAAVVANGGRALRDVPADGAIDISDDERLNCNDPDAWMRLAVAYGRTAAL